MAPKQRIASNWDGLFGMKLIQLIRNYIFDLFKWKKPALKVGID